MEKLEGPREAIESSGFYTRKLRTKDNCHQVCGRAPHPSCVMVSYLRSQLDMHVRELSRTAVPPHCSTAKPYSLRKIQNFLSGQTTFPQERTEESWFHQHRGLKSDTSKWARATCPHSRPGPGSKSLLKSVRLPYRSGQAQREAGLWAGNRWAAFPASDSTISHKWNKVLTGTARHPAGVRDLGGHQGRLSGSSCLLPSSHRTRSGAPLVSHREAAGGRAGGSSLVPGHWLASLTPLACPSGSSANLEQKASPKCPTSTKTLGDPLSIGSITSADV